MLRLPLAVLACCASLAACSTDPHGLSWGVRFATPADEARAVLVEARILRGGCDGTVVYAADLEIGAAVTAMAPGELEKGRYGFAARARDASCVWFAEECVEDDLPQEVATPIIVLLAAGPEMAACAPALCVDGRCEGEVRDGGTPDGGTPDGGRRDGGETPDGTVPDGFTPVPDGCVSSTEVCDDMDNDCNGAVDDGFRICGDEDATCVSGTCECGGGATYDMGRCYRTDQDPENCGTVGHVCATSEYCAMGSCECRVGLVRATSGERMGECVDRTSDPLACGSGYENCSDMGSMRSCRTNCEDACTSGQTTCSVSSGDCSASGCNACVPTTSLASHPLHCGGCGIACAVDEVCVGSACHTYRPGCSECEGADECCTYDGNSICVSGISTCPSSGTFWAP